MWKYQQLDKDLHNLVCKRIGEAVDSVAQLAETPEQRAMIVIAAFSHCAGMAGGAVIATSNGLDNDADPFNVAIGILEAARDEAA